MLAPADSSTMVPSRVVAAMSYCYRYCERMLWVC
jgi:hypothetical protein